MRLLRTILVAVVLLSGCSKSHRRSETPPEAERDGSTSTPQDWPAPGAEPEISDGCLGFEEFTPTVVDTPARQAALHGDRLYTAGSDADLGYVLSTRVLPDGEPVRHRFERFIVQGMVADGTGAYLTTMGYPTPSGRVEHLSPTGEHRVLTDGLINAAPLVVDGDLIFFDDSGIPTARPLPGKVWKMARKGGGPTLHASGIDVSRALAVHGEHLYMLSFRGQASRVSTQGGAVEPAFEPPVGVSGGDGRVVRSWALDEEAAFIVADGALWRVELGTGEARVLVPHLRVAKIQGRSATVLSGSHDVFFVREEPEESALYRVSKQGGPVERLAGPVAGLQAAQGRVVLYQPGSSFPPRSQSTPGLTLLCVSQEIRDPVDPATWEPMAPGPVFDAGPAEPTDRDCWDDGGVDPDLQCSCQTLKRPARTYCHPDGTLVPCYCTSTDAAFLGCEGGPSTATVSGQTPHGWIELSHGWYGTIRGECGGADSYLFNDGTPELGLIDQEERRPARIQSYPAVGMLNSPHLILNTAPVLPFIFDAPTEPNSVRVEVSVYAEGKGYATAWGRLSLSHSDGIRVHGELVVDGSTAQGTADQSDWNLHGVFDAVHCPKLTTRCAE